MTQVSDAEIKKILEGASYPARKQELINYASQKGATGEILDTLQKLPDVLYKTSDSLSNALHKLLPLDKLIDKLL